MTRHLSPASVSRWKPAEFLCHFHSVQKLLSFVKSTLKWRLMDRKPLPPTWVHPKGHLVLLGTACHPVLVCMSPAAQWNVLTDPLSLSQALPCSRRRDRSRRCGGPRRITLARLVTLTSSGPSPSLTGSSGHCVSAFLPPSLTQPTERPLHTHTKKGYRARQQRKTLHGSTKRSSTCPMDLRSARATK